ncbi:MAG: DUF5615 family PIN-like protein [Candidatus Omnitrophica bacterium]|nr:DUF5615 family PIN-like protein [Candidatus Omnitrophota bacterium]
MKFLADENIEKPLVDFLRGKGFDVLYVCEQHKSISDEEVLYLANQEDRILLTNDKDFGELIFLQRKISQGIVLIRLFSENTSDKIVLFNKLLKEYSDKLKRHFVVLTERQVRIRKLD